MEKVLVVCPNPSIDIFATIERFEYGVPNRITSEKQYPGGKGLHVAMALAELGVPVTLAGFWGGEAGQWIKKSCHKYYPDIEFIGPELETWSRSCYTFKSQGDFDDTEILGPGPTLDDTLIDRLLNEVNARLKDHSLMALCGSWPAGSRVTAYAELIQLGRKHSVRTFLDCTGQQLLNALKEHPYAVHLNRKEIADFFGSEDFEANKNQLLNQVDLAIVTDGARGLFLGNATGWSHSLSQVEKVISTIGSGDCLLSGILFGVLNNYSLAQTAAMGASCGAANCLRADLGMLFQKDVDDLLIQNRTTAV